MKLFYKNIFKANKNINAAISIYIKITNISLIIALSAISELFSSSCILANLFKSIQLRLTPAAIEQELSFSDVTAFVNTSAILIFVLTYANFTVRSAIFSRTK